MKRLSLTPFIKNSLASLLKLIWKQKNTAVFETLFKLHQILSTNLTVLKHPIRTLLIHTRWTKLSNLILKFSLENRHSQKSIICTMSSLTLLLKSTSQANSRHFARFTAAAYKILFEASFKVIFGKTTPAARPSLNFTFLTTRSMCLKLCDRMTSRCSRTWVEAIFNTWRVHFHSNALQLLLRHSVFSKSGWR